MEAADTYELLVPAYQTTGCHIPEDSIISIVAIECYNSVEIWVICVGDWWSCFASQFQNQKLNWGASYSFP
jgi:hypothetical protein